MLLKWIMSSEKVESLDKYLEEIDEEDDKSSKGSKRSSGVSVEGFFLDNKVPITLLLIGMMLLGAGVFWNKGGFSSGSSNIEIVENTATQQESEVVVEVSGAVVKQGVYKLKSGSRVEDALVAAGGISADADRDWMEKTVNRAAKLTDGQKVYIASVNEQSDVMSANSSSLNEDSGENTNNTQTNLVNINTASQSELESLWGIGPVTAQNIIEQRPYSSVEELMSRKILKSNVYERNKDLLSVY